MPPVRTVSNGFKFSKLAQRTERSHEENQERAYIAASRRSDRSLEARVESARRASEIHKKRTGRALRVREEDVLNEEMYEEEDDELSQQMRRMNALHPGFTSFSDRLNSYMAGHLGIRSALQQAILNANQWQAQQLMNPASQNSDMISPPGGNHHYNSAPQSPWSFGHLNGANQPQLHNRSASVATTHEFSTYQHAPTARGERRPSLPVPILPSTGLRSPSLSHPDSAGSSNPPTPHGFGTSTSKHSGSPLQVPTPPHSNQAGSQMASDASSGTQTPRQPYSQSPNTQIAPLTTKLPVETQQLFDGSQQTFHQNFFPEQMSAVHGVASAGSYSYNPNGKPKSYMDNFSASRGLNQTLSPATLDQHSAASLSDSLPSTYAPVDLNATAHQDPFHDLGIVPDMHFDFESVDYGAGFEGGSHTSGSLTPGVNGDPLWNPDDFFNFGSAE